MAKGYSTYYGEFYEYDDASSLCIGKYEDIASGRVSAYWLEDVRTEMITESTFDKLEEEGAIVSDVAKYTFYNDYDGEPVVCDEIHQIALSKYIDVVNGRVSGYMAELEREYIISESTYEALAEHGAYGTGREILTFYNDYNGQPVVFEDARYVHIEEIKDVASGYAGGYKAIYNDAEFMISSSTYNALKDAGALCNEEA